MKWNEWMAGLVNFVDRQNYLKLLQFLWCDKNEQSKMVKMEGYLRFYDFLRIFTNIYDLLRMLTISYDLLRF